MLHQGLQAGQPHVKKILRTSVHTNYKARVTTNKQTKKSLLASLLSEKQENSELTTKTGFNNRMAFPPTHMFDETQILFSLCITVNKRALLNLVLLLRNKSGTNLDQTF